MSNKMREVFGIDFPERLKNNKIADNPPCNNCAIHKDYMYN